MATCAWRRLVNPYLVPEQKVRGIADSSSVGVDWLPENWQLIGEMTLLTPNLTFLALVRLGNY